MQFLKLLLLIFLLTSLLNIFSQDERRDGNYWNELNINSKLDYVIGFFDGKHLGHSFSYWGLMDENKDDKCLPKIYESFDDYNIKYFSNVTNSQIVDGLNELYSDYRNRRIIIYGAIWIVVNSIAGTSNEEMELLIKSWRENSVN